MLLLDKVTLFFLVLWNIWARLSIGREIRVGWFVCVLFHENTLAEFFGKKNMKRKMMTFQNPNSTSKHNSKRSSSHVLIEWTGKAKEGLDAGETNWRL